MGKDKGHNPIRTCVSCGAKRNKKELIRLVLDAQGVVIRDDSSKGKGRGAYVCMSKSCWENLQRGRRLNRAFRKEGPMVVHAGGHFQEGKPPGGKKLTLGE
jgi:uncharacterized protein